MYLGLPDSENSRGQRRMKMMREMKNFLQDESGQTTTEYFLILAVVVTIFMQFRKKLLGMLDKLFNGIDGATEKAMSEMNSGSN